MIRPLIAIDLNSKLGYSAIRKFILRVLRAFGIADVVFIIDDKNIMEFADSQVFPISDSLSIVELVRSLRKVSESREELDIEPVISLKKEMGRSILIVLSDREVKCTEELVFKYNGRRLKRV